MVSERKEETAVRGIMKLHQDLTWRFTLCFTPAEGSFTKEEAFVNFDASSVLNEAAFDEKTMHTTVL